MLFDSFNSKQNLSRKVKTFIIKVYKIGYKIILYNFNSFKL